MAKTNTKHFQHYTQNVLNQNTLEELLEEELELDESEFDLE